MSRRAAPHRGIDQHYGEAERPSKTQLKQQSDELQKLGLALAELGDEALHRIDMPEALRDAISTYRRTRSHEGRRRQLQFVGKLMRSADEAPLREALAEATLGSAQAALLLHQIEQWRAELVADDTAFERWLATYPDSDGQRLRSLVRAARRDGALNDPATRQPRALRELFQFIKPHLTTHG